MALKLITQIKRYLEAEAQPELTIQEAKTLPKGLYYDLKKGDFRFCLVLQDLKAGVRANWIFHTDLTTGEIEYWSGKYDFKIQDENKLTKSHLQITDIENHEEVKVLMNRFIPTIRVFRKDLKWILFMARERNKT